MRILVTGGSGFIGSHLAEHFQGKAHVRVLDNLRTGHRRNLAGLDVEFIEGSVTDRDVVRRAVEGVDFVFHLAALVSVPDEGVPKAPPLTTGDPAEPTLTPNAVATPVPSPVIFPTSTSFIFALVIAPLSTVQVAPVPETVMSPLSPSVTPPVPEPAPLMI